MLDEKEIKTGAKIASLLNTSADLQGPTFVILNNHTSARVTKEYVYSIERTKEDERPKGIGLWKKLGCSAESIER